MDELNLDNILEGEKAVMPKISAYKMVALRGVVVFPTQTLHFDVGRDKSMLALERAKADNENIFLVAQKEASVSNPSEKDIYRVGVIARIQQIIKLPNETARVMVTGLERMVIDNYVSTFPCFEVALSPFATVDSNEDDVKAVKHAISDQLESFLKLDHKIPKENLPLLKTDDTEKFIAAASAFVFEKDADRQDLLETNNVYEQLEKIYTRLVALCEILAAEKRIALKVRESVDKNQKEYYLREQIKAIHSELGDDEE